MEERNEYPPECPQCGAEAWLDLDLDTAEVFCIFCGYHPDFEEEY